MIYRNIIKMNNKKIKELKNEYTENKEFKYILRFKI